MGKTYRGKAKLIAKVRKARRKMVRKIKSAALVTKTISEQF